MGDKKYHNIESTIRDWLSINLEFIENGLSLIKTEFPLPDELGSKGFIDILAKDTYNNFVIIEIKRANSTARQAFTEILKYHALIKQRYKAKDSEIRIIIISTHWSELIRAFSELKNRTTFAIKGFKIDIDPVTYIPYSIEEKHSIPISLLDRHFPRIYSLDLFSTKEKRTSFIKAIKALCKKVNINNYIILEMDATKDMFYSYASVFAWQKLSNEELVSKVTILNAEFEDEKEEYETAEEYTHYLEEQLIIAFCKNTPHGEIEAGYPEKIDAELNNGNWTISHIHKSGIFAEDPRYHDELLLSEIRGLEGNSYERYFFIAESTQPARLLEMINNCKQCLENASPWTDVILFRLNQITSKEEYARVGLYVYNPVSTLKNLVLAATKDYVGYMPYYQMVISNIEGSAIEIYWGDISWNGEKSNYSLFSGKKSHFNILTEIELGITHEEMILFRSNLYFSNNKILMEYGKETTYSLVKLNYNEDEIIVDQRQKKSFHEYFEKKPNVIDELVSIYSKYSNLF